MEALYNNVVSFANEYPLLKEYGIYGAIAVGFALYGASLAIYRLYFHPLAGFPGPKIAAATRWYEFYYDVIKRGKYVYKIEEMHRKYGKVPLFLLRYQDYISVREHIRQTQN
jgi:hypothetical protein